ncbi:MAG: hypothetical protein AAF926_04195 [Pseudomonadota bacterium]
MGSRKLSLPGIGVMVAVMTLIFNLGHDRIPFDGGLPRILASGLLGGLAAAIGVLVAYAFRLTVPVDDEK